MKQTILAAACALCAMSLSAQISLPRIFTDNMVIQQNAQLTIPGTASPDSKVTVTTDWLSKPVSVNAGKDGKFTVKLNTPEAGGPYTIIISDGKDTKVLQNVLSGEVWLCSGQSNMEFPIRGNWARLMDADEVVAQMQRPALRLLQVRNTLSYTPLDNADIEMGWVESSPAAAEFSALAYLCGKMLQDSLNIPVGVIDATWGGTPVEAWTPLEGIKGIEGFEYAVNQLSTGNFPTNEEIKNKMVSKSYNANKNPDKIKLDFDKSVMQTGKAWGKMPVPSQWENNVLPGFNGVVFMQYELDLPADAAGKPLHLHFDGIDDVDDTYFNGQFVGSDIEYHKARDYAVDGKYVKAGKNVITVRVIDTGGEGGIWKPATATVNGRTYDLSGEWNYAIAGDTIEPIMFGGSNYPTVLYNAMINPLTVMPIAGAFWYQGCNNVGRDKQYEACFKSMIQQWRKAFNKPDMPFYFVQLAGFQQPVTVQPNSDWALLRQAQAATLELPNTGMATAIDLGNPIDIHPTNKAELARRLGLLALDKTYGRKQICEAPVCTSVKAQGNKISVSFSGDVTAVGGTPTGFIIGDKDGNWAYANAKFEGGSKIVLSSPLIKNPVAVRYNWADYPGGNLYGPNNLAVAPFAK